MKMASDYPTHSRSDRNPVLLIHGLHDTTAVFHRMETYLTSLGWSVHSLNLIPNNGAFALEHLATQVADYVTTAFAPEQSLDLVGFSMGGIVTRYYLQRLGGINRVNRYISISAPNYGTATAYVLQHPGIVQMRPDSLFLRDLNRDGEHMLERVNFTLMWTPFDLMIIPAQSSQMPVGREVKLPVLLHSWMLSDSRALEAVAVALSEPLKSDRQSQLTHVRQKSLQNDGRT
ncbi:MAG: esterase/lipase family protein [Xenococcaceae cyanobacterium]